MMGRWSRAGSAHETMSIGDLGPQLIRPAFAQLFAG